MLRTLLRFWHMHYGSPVRVSLKMGESVEFWESEGTDEGWRSRATYYTLTEDGLVKSVWNRERDCDGLYEHAADYEAPIRLSRARYQRVYVKLFHVPADERTDVAVAEGRDSLGTWTTTRPLVFPAFERVGRERNRDYSAEAAGY